MSNSLFKDFEPVSAKQWKQKIQVDLKGADYNDALIWKSNEGIDIKPFYHSDHFESLPETSETQISNFKICQTVFVDDVSVSNHLALDAINRGAEALRFIIPSSSVSLGALLDGIDATDIRIYLELQFLDSEYLKTIPHQNTFILNDIIGNLARSGNWFSNLKDDHILFENTLKQSQQLSVDVSLYQNAGANMVQQLSYAMAHVSEYFNFLNDRISDAEKQQIQPIFKISVGTNYFFEIAKLKALRTIYRPIAKAFGYDPKCHILAAPTKRNKCIYDYNVNLLRTTTECMSAILGGANSINNLAYDAIYHKDNEFGQRIARNQLLILKNESYFDKVDNPTDGSYYIEQLTDELAEKALVLYKNIEANGGFLAQLKSGVIQKKIKESAEKEQAQFESGELVLLGANKHPNNDDKMKNELELYPFIKTNPVKTLIEPIIPKRLSEKIEKERLENESGG